MKEKVRIGYVGLGARGMAILEHSIAVMADVDIVTICDVYQPAVDAALAMLERKGVPAPKTTADYRDIVNDPTIDAVFLMNGWEGRVDMAVDCLLAGKYTATEVGCADTLDDCYRLLAAHKKTGAPLMMLENICYFRRELTLLHMARTGVFGDVVHCAGGYHHDLTECVLFKNMERVDANYRLKAFTERNGDQYPTHELGPISKLLGLGRGNRMVSLTSHSARPAGIRAAAERILGADSPYAQKSYLQSDIVETIITCAGGETIRLCLDTTLPRPYYSRNFTVRGTAGMYTEERKVYYLAGMPENVENNEEEMYERYEHPLYRRYRAEGERGGHGGADFITMRAFIEAVKRGTDTPIDIYDTLAWMAIGPLTEESIAKGGVPVEIPDFTDGAWQNPAPRDLGPFSLDIISEEEVPICPKYR